jgi:hypothetical protein
VAVGTITLSGSAAPSALLKVVVLAVAVLSLEVDEADEFEIVRSGSVSSAAPTTALSGSAAPSEAVAFTASPITASPTTASPSKRSRRRAKPSVKGSS